MDFMVLMLHGTSMQHVDPTLYKSLLDLKQYATARDNIVRNTTLSEEHKSKLMSEISVRGAKIEDLCLDYTMPGYPDVELIPNGSSISLTVDNVSEYIDQVVDLTVGSGVTKQIDAFRAGFNRVFSVTDLHGFSVQELGLLISGNENEDWSLESEYRIYNMPLLKRTCSINVSKYENFSVG
jgi:E3 ubiquitin-protein ligase TRIP12